MDPPHISIQPLQIPKLLILTILTLHITRRHGGPLHCSWRTLILRRQTPILTRHSYLVHVAQIIHVAVGASWETEEVVVVGKPEAEIVFVGNGCERFGVGGSTQAPFSPSVDCLPSDTGTSTPSTLVPLFSPQAMADAAPRMLMSNFCMNKESEGRSGSVKGERAGLLTGKSCSSG